MRNFNSIKVRLEPHIKLETTVEDIYFNSIKVRLEHRDAMKNIPTNQYFNSIKVRLELSYSFSNLYFSLFQFHKGAIRTPLLQGSATPCRGFQFHKGAIRTWLTL